MVRRIGPGGGGGGGDGGEQALRVHLGQLLAGAVLEGTPRVQFMLGTVFYAAHRPMDALAMFAAAAAQPGFWEAREALVNYLSDCMKRERRCIRVIHGKGLGSINKEPVLKGKVLKWLAQRNEVLAFCQAAPTDGGSGALIVLLRPPASKTRKR
jgi:hypothetical protein